MSLAAAFHGPGSYTWDEYQDFPEDGKLYESFGGVLIVSPPPLILHQLAVGRLYRLLCDAAPPELLVLTAPCAWFVNQTEWYEPDIMVVPKDGLDLHGPFRGTPVLVAEVTSPSTRIIAHNLKRETYQSGGCPHYWIVDPEIPSLLALSIDGGTYGEVGSVSDAEVFPATSPFPVEVCPAELVAL